MAPRAISAAEKYRELAAAGRERPVCVCHGKPRGWQKDDRPQGGQWRCLVQHYLRNDRWRQSEKGRIVTVRYMQSAKGRATDRRYRQSEKGIASNHRYDHSEKGLITARRGWQKPGGGWDRRKLKTLAIYQARLARLDAVEGVLRS